MTSTSITRVFVVDDESVIAFTLAAILGRSGFAAFPFTHPKEALLHAQSDPPDLLISDVMMPEMSGIDLAIQIKVGSPGTHVLLFSGQAATADLLKSARAEGHDFRLLTKPVHPTDLLAAVRLLTNPLGAGSTD
jgi:DNA-binding response OmpR family regulator